MTVPLLKVRGLSKSYQTGGIFSRERIQALTEINFDLNVGEVVALVGESGSGKSTIARQLVRLERPDSGQILLHGRDILASNRISLADRRRVQMIFQDPFGSLNPVHTIAHHLARPLLRHGKVSTKKDEVRAEVLALLNRVGLAPAEDFADAFPHSLSGGQRQRVAIARALAPGPELILADEPTSMLDVSIRLGVLNLLKSLKAQGISIIFITHDLASARYLADRVLVLYQGKIVEHGTTKEVLTTPRHAYTKLLLAAVPHPDVPIDTPLPPRPNMLAAGHSSTIETGIE